LGENYAGSGEFSGYTTEIHEISIPMAFVLDETVGGDGTSDIIISKEGVGRLYYRARLKYAPTDLMLGSPGYGVL